MFTEEDEDDISLLSTLKGDVFSRLDQYIKVQLQKRGITIIENTYAAFDTEFELEDSKKHLNTLLSVQTAVQARTLVKVPLYREYDISYVHPLTSEMSSIFKNKIDSKHPYIYTFTPPSYSSKKEGRPAPREIVILNNSLKKIIKSTRDLLFPSMIDATASIVDSLKSIEGATHFDDLKRDQAVILLPLSELETSVEIAPEISSTFSLSRLLAMSKCQSGAPRKRFISIIDIFYRLGLQTDRNKILEFYEVSSSKPRSRTKLQFSHNGFDLLISLSVIKNLFSIAHYNAADLPNIIDFGELKDKLSIVNKSFVTLGKPLTVEGTNLYIRDTILLSPAGASKLADLGKIYKLSGSDLEKLDVPFDKNHMSEFLRDNPESFKAYGIRDATITLKHALAMEEFNRTVNQIGIPLTLSSIGRMYVLKAFNDMDRFLPYQISGEYMMGNANEVQTPKGLHATGQVGSHMSYFIANYKGGRNESFMYGCDENTRFYDYDLTSAYTTGMADLPLPDYHKGRLLKHKDLEDLRKRKGKWASATSFLTGYLIVNTKFTFPENTKFPSIPCYIDKTSTVYPLKGEGFLTGPEYLLAINQKCEFNIKSAFYIPPKCKTIIMDTEDIKVPIKPFSAIFEEIQKQRREYAKGTINNYFYKEMGNSIYGNVVRGISNKMSFDCKSGQSFRVSGTALSNPILAS